MQESREATPWKQITLFLITLAVLILCALILKPFFSAIVLAIVLAVALLPPAISMARTLRQSERRNEILSELAKFQEHLRERSEPANGAKPE